MKAHTHRKNYLSNSKISIKRVSRLHGLHLILSSVIFDSLHLRTDFFLDLLIRADFFFRTKKVE